MELPELADYVSRNPVFVILGSGASSGRGLPTWTELTKRVVRTAEAAKLPEEFVLEADRRIRGGDLPGALGVVENGLGREALLIAFRGTLFSTFSRGTTPIIDFLVRHPFGGFLTTNYDTLLDDALSKAVHSARSYGNGQLDVRQAAAGFELNDAVVHIHGRLTPPEEGAIPATDHVVITTKDYELVGSAPQFEHLRTFLTQVFGNRVLFLGYSLSDPDLNALLAFLKQRLGRSFVAVLPDVRTPRRVELAQQYGIEVVSYRTREADHPHEGLERLLSALDRLVPRRDEPVRNRTLSDITKRERLLFMWVRTQQEGSSELQAAALKSMLLSELAEADAPVPMSEVPQLLRNDVGLATRLLDQLVPEVVDEIVREGLAEGTEQLTLTAAGARAVQTARDGLQVLEEGFRADLAFAVREATDVSGELLTTLTNSGVESVLDVFESAGSDLAAAVLSGQELRPPVARSVLKIVAGRANEVPEEHRYHLIDVVMKFIVEPPSERSRRHLEAIAHTYLASGLLDRDTDGRAYRGELASNRELLLDSNILIPACAVGSAVHSTVRGLLETARDAGISLATTEGFVDELITHFDWAEAHIRRHGIQSLDTAAAALGEGGYSANAFVQGFATVGSSTFAEYTRRCLPDGDSRPQGFERWLSNLGIKLHRVSDVGRANQSVYERREALAEQARQDANERGIEKSDSRMSAEADAVAVLEALEAVDATDSPLRRSVLTQGTYLDRLALSAASSLGERVVMSLDALAALLVRLGEPPRERFSLRELLLQSRYDLSHLFVDRPSVERFFAPVLSDYEAAYISAPDRFLAGLADGVVREDRFHLATRVAGLMTTQSERVAQLEREIAELRRQLGVAQQTPATIRNAEHARRQRKNAARQKKRRK